MVKSAMWSKLIMKVGGYIFPYFSILGLYVVILCDQFFWTKLWTIYISDLKC